jgi:hypothetical protein
LFCGAFAGYAGAAGPWMRDREEEEVVVVVEEEEEKEVPSATL